MSSPSACQELLGQTVVVDTDSHFIYLGRLESLDAQFMKLSQVDVHEIGASSLSKERYVHEASEIGLRANRKMTWVRMERVMSVSRLEDVIEF